jgi:hypothetical protein
MPYLKQVVKKGQYPRFMMSGRTHNAQTFTRHVQTERQPLDTPETVHKVMDEIFYKKFKVKARSQSIFCTGSEGIASAYGNPFLIFPIGKFTFLWSPQTKDMYDRIRRMGDEVNVRLDRGARPSEEDLEKAINFMEQVANGYIKRDLQKAIASGHEIMVQCREYFAVDMGSYEEYFTLFFKNHGIKRATPELFGEFMDIERAQYKTSIPLI